MPQEVAPREVVIVQDRVPHYRVAFFGELRDLLRAKGVTLRLLHAHRNERSEYSAESNFYVDLDWAEPFQKRDLPGGATWYPVLATIKTADLVIVEAASKRLLNYALLLLRCIGGPRLAFWGHGWSHKTARPQGISERVKVWLGKQADWYFAYTWSVRQGLVERGYDPERITDVQNAVPKPAVSKVRRDPAAIRKALGIHEAAPVVLYCGRMYPNKRLDLLVQAIEIVRATVPEIVLLLVGGGPSEHVARQATASHDYIKYLGPLFGEDKAELFQIARLVAMPGLVGLGVVDAFQHGVPPVATTYPFHSPEFAYLQDGINGLVAGDNATEFAEAIRRLVVDDELHRRLEEGSRFASESITIHEMADRFAGGVLKALGSTGG